MPQRDTRTQETGRVLKDLLSDVLRYRRCWLVHAKRFRGVLNQAAVAQVVIEHLWDSGYAESKASRNLKDVVSRALSGVSLTVETLRHFMDAFEMAPEHCELLWATYHGAAGTGTGVSHRLLDRREMLTEQRHRTQNLIESYRVGAVGALRSRRTSQTLRATDGPVDTYIYSHEPQVAAVQVRYGGRAGVRQRYGNGLHCTEIELDPPLTVWQWTSLEYLTYYRRGWMATEVRRAVFAEARFISMEVVFDGRLPKDAWWCVWSDQLEGTPVLETRVDVSDRAIRWRLGPIAESVIGFRWCW